jgi:hypothetical protein
VVGDGGLRDMVLGRLGLRVRRDLGVRDRPRGLERF